MEKANCVFCKIISGEIPAKKFYEDDQFCIILDAGPASKGHSLIIPKAHYTDLWELPEEIAAESMKLARRISAKMKAALGCDGFNLVQNNGYAAGQSVFHYHLHLIPRYEGEEKMLNWKVGEMPQEEQEEIRKMLAASSDQ